MEYLTVQEAAEVAKVSPNKIRALCQERRFPASDLGTKKRHIWRIEKEGFIDYMKRGRA